MRCAPHCLAILPGEAVMVGGREAMSQRKQLVRVTHKQLLLVQL